MPSNGTSGETGKVIGADVIGADVVGADVIGAGVIARAVIVTGLFEMALAFVMFHPKDPADKRLVAFLTLWSFSCLAGGLYALWAVTRSQGRGPLHGPGSPPPGRSILSVALVSFGLSFVLTAASYAFTLHPVRHKALESLGLDPARPVWLDLVWFAAPAWIAATVFPFLLRNLGRHRTAMVLVALTFVLVAAAAVIRLAEPLGLTLSSSGSVIVPVLGIALGCGVLALDLAIGARPGPPLGDSPRP